jgi:hypothetical protein
MEIQKATTSLVSSRRYVLDLRRALVTAAALTVSIGMAGARTEAAPAPTGKKPAPARGHHGRGGEGAALSSPAGL